MNSSRCSSLLVLILALGLVVGAAGAVSVSESEVPSEGAVGSDAAARIVLDELFRNPPYEQWTLHGETELDNVTWTVQVVDQAGNQLVQPSYDSQSFDHGVDIESGAAEVTVSVTGSVPAIGNYTYEPAESFLFVELQLVRQGGTSETIVTHEAHHFTEQSREAREAIDTARAAIRDAGGHQEANRTVESAVSAYENENFENAVRLADQARETAGRAQSNQARNRLILMGVGVVILLGIIAGGVIYWRRTRSHSRL